MAYIPVILLFGLLGTVVYSMFTGAQVNFALLLFSAVVITGIAWALDKWVWSKKREAGEPAPWHIDLPASIFGVLAIVFVLRSFLVEPFKIPSSSMRPTLEVGDFILVNKFAYGFRLPIIEKKVIPTSDPKRGDVVVFRYPQNPSQDYIKRLVGVPGDVVSYQDKRLTINGQALPTTAKGSYSYVTEDGSGLQTNERYREDVTGVVHDIAVLADRRSVAGPVDRFPGSENCSYQPEGRGFTCKVPAGQYFMMGDNRDNSLDSRYWGFVPDDHLRGRAFFIWWNTSDIFGFAFKRVGSSIR